MKYFHLFRKMIVHKHVHKKMRREAKLIDSAAAAGITYKLRNQRLGKNRGCRLLSWQLSFIILIYR